MSTAVMALVMVIIASVELVAAVPLGVRASIAMPIHVQPTNNVTVVLGANNVQGQVTWPTVKLLGVVDSFALCEELCFNARRARLRPEAEQEHDQQQTPSRSYHGRGAVAPGRKDQAHAFSVIDGDASCLSFTYHHLDFAKPEYRGHCYEHTDAMWAPVEQRGDLANTSLLHPLCCNAQYAFVHFASFFYVGSSLVSIFHLCRSRPRRALRRIHNCSCSSSFHATRLVFVPHDLQLSKRSCWRSSLLWACILIIAF